MSPTRGTVSTTTHELEKIEPDRRASLETRKSVYRLKCSRTTSIRIFSSKNPQGQMQPDIPKNELKIVDQGPQKIEAIRLFMLSAIRFMKPWEQVLWMPGALELLCMVELIRWFALNPGDAVWFKLCLLSWRLFGCSSRWTSFFGSWDG